MYAAVGFESYHLFLFVHSACDKEVNSLGAGDLLDILGCWQDTSDMVV